MKKNKITIITFIIISLIPFTFAHFPYYIDHKTSISNPIFIDNIHRSQVWYFQQNTPNSNIWLKFTVNTSDQLFIQLGVPQHKKFINYNPILEIYYQNNTLNQPQKQVSYTTNFLKPSTSCTSNPETAVPCLFYEPFTNTYSWILVEKHLPLTPGNYYIQGLSPNQGTMWIAVGEIEDFSGNQLPNLIFTTNQIKNAHGNNNYLLLFLIIIVILSILLITYKYKITK